MIKALSYSMFQRRNPESDIPKNPTRKLAVADEKPLPAGHVLDADDDTQTASKPVPVIDENGDLEIYLRVKRSGNSARFRGKWSFSPTFEDEHFLGGNSHELGIALMKIFEEGAL